jgi:alkylation response protein AidB-like acyl-CoA dehydrogenase
MDLDLSPEHVLLRDTIRDFMLTEVAPVIDEHERERRFPSEIVRRIGELGWLGIPFPEDEGGAGLDTLAYAIAVEEIGRVWGSLGLIVAAHTSLGCGPLHLAGTPEQKERWLVPMAQGQVLGAYGLTEPEAGSDSGGTRTAARHEEGPDGGSWVIDGHKRFITNAGGQVSNVSAYALGMDFESPMATPEVTEAREKLVEFTAMLNDLASWIPANGGQSPPSPMPSAGNPNGSYENRLTTSR